MTTNSFLIVHAGWLVPQGDNFYNHGRFIIWIESSIQQKSLTDTALHPCHLFKKTDLNCLLKDIFHFNQATLSLLPTTPVEFFIQLPGLNDAPLPSFEMAQLQGELVLEKPQWQNWKLTGIAIDNPLLFLKEMQFLAMQTNALFRYGQSLQFWIHYAAHLRDLIRQDQYLPILKGHQTGRKKSDLKIETGWEPVSYIYEQGLSDYSQAMPFCCRTLFAKNNSKGKQPNFWQAEALLRHFAEQQVNALISQMPITQKLGKTIADSWISNTLENQNKACKIELKQTHLQEYTNWKNAIVGDAKQGGFIPGFRLDAEQTQSATLWSIVFFVESRKDPSLKLELQEIWQNNAGNLNTQDTFIRDSFLGDQFEKELLLALGQAARICPLLWDGMETAQPTGLEISLNMAYDFLKNDMPILESAGFKITVPSWWTAKGRQRARIRVKTSTTSSPSQETNGGYFNLPSLVQYQYELAVGENPVTAEEWQMLVNSKSPLVEFRGQWMEIDSDQMTELLKLMQQPMENSVSLIDMVKQAAEANYNEREFVFDEVLTELLQRLQNRHDMPALDSPKTLNGSLRKYQQQGLSWLAYQEALGLHPCLADDMGLGKTIQVIALLLQERLLTTNTIGSTLLIAPTSVLGNWHKEIERFAPGLTSFIHHGSQRTKKPKEFADIIQNHDIIITSFSLIRKDAKLLNATHWHRVVIDEAQNIKNPKSAQTKAVQQLKANHRLAMTGTPIENRLMDMWSIFHFLNPGYLGTTTQFKKAYETPIQRDGNAARAEQLRKLLQPFILRRLKTDKNIISDLPDKIEQKVYCNLTKEQASLYQAVVDDVQKQLEQAEGIQRKGLILSTLMKLKQICNHPAQFLQDNSDFDSKRSHKLARIGEMIAEALEEGDSLLVFTQFTEIGSALEKQLRQQHKCPVYYLHGATPRKKREVMINQFQDDTTPSGIFILSLKAGGVGITLTQANHVFHFDRWWNPAVEDQATDRAFRIGQKKTVFAHKMVTLGTLEERIDKMLEDKKKLASIIVGNDESWLTEMDNDAFNALIQLNRNTIMEA